MAITRRQTLLSALGGALVLATPQSVLALQLADDKRFIVVELASGDYLAIDREDGDRVRLLRRTVADGDYALAEAGAIAVAQGKVVGVRSLGEGKHYSLAREGDVLVVRARATRGKVQRIAIAAGGDPEG